MQVTRLQFSAVLCSALLYFGFFNFNHWCFAELEFAPGVNWIFLPAGLRLLCTLLFAGAGAWGIFFASLAIMWLNFPELDLLTSLGSACVSAGAPYLAYRISLHFGMPATLLQLNTARLLMLTIIFAATSSLTHQIWFVMRGRSDDLLTGFGAMFTGDLLGSLLLLYLIKILLATGRRLFSPAQIDH